MKWSGQFPAHGQDPAVLDPEGAGGQFGPFHGDDPGVGEGRGFRLGGQGQRQESQDSQESQEQGRQEGGHGDFSGASLAGENVT